VNDLRAYAIGGRADVVSQDSRQKFGDEREHRHDDVGNQVHAATPGTKI